MKRILLIVALNLTLLSAMSHKVDVNVTDDWEYNATSSTDEFKRNMSMSGNIKRMSMAAPSLAKKGLGLAVGGAKDTNNFKANLENGYLPKLNSITYEGQFYNHYFETGLQGECKELFCPSYSSAKRTNQFTDEEEYFLSVGLNSGIEEGDFKRKKLNLVVVVDISGSMGSKFNSYYYDKVGNKIENKEQEKKSKMTIANESIVAMLSHLKDDDRAGVVLFDHSAYLAKPLREVGKTDKKAIAKHILELQPKGGTNWSAGYKEGLKLFDEVENNSEYENRIIFLTDAMPNRGELNKGKLFGMAKDASAKGIHTTFVGIGVDFNNDLVEYVSKTKGANYFSVHSSKEFAQLLDKEFDYMVTPLVYDLELKLSNSNYTIEAVYGSPEADLSTGDILRVNTLFPSHNDGTATKGGVILVKLKKGNEGNESKKLTLNVSYSDVNGKEYNNSQEVAFKSQKSYFDNSGIEKAILVSDYVSIMKNWLIDSRAACNDKVSWANQQPIEIQKRCMLYPPMHPDYPNVSTWERRSCKLKVSGGYKKLLFLFKKYYMKEMELLKDDSLGKELTLINLLLNTKRETSKVYQNAPRDDWRYGK